MPAPPRDPEGTRQPGIRRPGPRTLAGALALAMLLCSAAAAADETRRLDGDDDSQPRHGAEEDTGFTGYPAEPGPDSPYYDTTRHHRAYSPSWTGAFVGFGLLGGFATWKHDAFDNGSIAPAWGVFANVSSASQILDLQLSWHGSRASGSFDDAEASLRRDSLSLSLLAHPAFLGLLFGDRFGYTIAQFYGMIGLSADFTSLDSPAVSESWTDFGWHLGAGIDTYFRRPERGRSWWIGPQYRFHRVSGTFDDPALARRSFNEHVLLLRLSFRIHGNLLRGHMAPDVP